MGNRPPVPITATFPFDVQFSTDPDTADRQRAEFMEHAQNAIVDIGLLGINRTKLANVETILECFALDDADIGEAGYVVPILDRDCAERLLAGGLLDRTAADIVARWGVVQPSIPWDAGDL